ncbi:amidohydrolase [Thalassospira sp. MCCC 1A01428]|uniref:amidohydrolase n=1 Tax=Thalassospira sp. MCCC 1A01428 TaxID=1470575 RepID=UPI000A1DEFE4|nr:amidohydrolase [Thalassospira sp. MCCC 1A01428]OSQ42695.1 peptidase M20 [Thalassospira sp. MCCC 1A01428]
MPIINRIAEFHTEMSQWRHHLHANPELSYQEYETARFVAQKLRSYGIEVTEGVGGTGVVGVLYGNRKGARSIGLRADMDALAIEERNDFAHRSVNKGVMHACGHDGHTTMLLGAARYLAETKNFAGRVVFIFQPAEEMGGKDGGAARMIREGLFTKFQCDEIYGIHNWPGMDIGTFAVKAGPMMASGDSFEIEVTATGMHAAQPQKGADVVLTAGHILVALQQVSARNIDPLDAIVVSATQIHGGDAYNVLPNKVTICGTVRAFSPAARAAAEPAIRRIIDGIALSTGAQCKLSYHQQYPTLINSHAAALTAEAAGLSVFNKVDTNPPQTMIVEDFAFMLEDRPGCYGWIGNGPDDNARILHSAWFDFNNDALPYGASYFAALVEAP